MPDPEFGRITDDKIDRLSARIGLDLDPANFEPPAVDPATWRPNLTGYNHEVTGDGIRHFVHGYGDDNPLYCDEHYADQSPWSGIIAPPTFVWTMYLPPSDSDVTYGGADEPPRAMRPEIRELFDGDPLRGTGSLQSQVEYEFYRPLRLGDRLYAKRSLLSVEDKDSSWGGRAVHVRWGLVTWNQRREIVHFQRGTWIRAERKRRDANGNSGTKKKLQLPAEPYQADQLAEIDAAYAAESKRGRERLYWEDVQVGAELPLRVKGPLRLTDVILWHAGFGQAFPTYAFRRAYEKRIETPGLYTPNEYNVPDIVQRMHWDAEWARKVGAAERYDYGALRETWLCQLITDWAGDLCWITSLEVEHRRFNYVGDTTWLKGRVVGKTIDDDRPRVRLEVWCENQHGEITSPGTAEVAVPSRSFALELPRPRVDDPLELLRSEVARFASRAVDRPG